jgi:exodeoxyribonuclease V alpha subunit
VDVAKDVVFRPGSPHGKDIPGTRYTFSRRSGWCFKLYDKVMQVRNNYDKEVFNGDIGYISAVNTEDRTLTINFDGREIEYDHAELDEVTLAYATTVHKAQGSEFSIVVIPLLMTHYVMLQRNLIYTGITRAKRISVLIGLPGYWKAVFTWCQEEVMISYQTTVFSGRGSSNRC